MEAPRRAALLGGIRDVVCLLHSSEASKQAACDDLLRKAGATWKDMLVLEVAPTDPEPVRQANVCAYVVYELRHLADPMALPRVALLRAIAMKNRRAMEELKSIVSEFLRRGDAENEELRCRAESAPGHRTFLGTAQ